MSKQVQTIQQITQYGNLKVGFIPLDIANAVIIAANVVQNTTEGGRPDGNTAPTLAARQRGHRQGAPRDLGGGLVRWSCSSRRWRCLRIWIRTRPSRCICLRQGREREHASPSTCRRSSAWATRSAAAATGTIAQARAEYVGRDRRRRRSGASGACSTSSLVPGAHAGDALYLDAAWLEYTEGVTAYTQADGAQMTVRRAQQVRVVNAFGYGGVLSARAPPRRSPSGIVMKDSDEERHRGRLYARLFVDLADFATRAGPRRRGDHRRRDVHRVRGADRRDGRRDAVPARGGVRLLWLACGSTRRRRSASTA